MIENGKCFVCGVNIYPAYIDGIRLICQDCECGCGQPIKHTCEEVKEDVLE